MGFKYIIVRLFAVCAILNLVACADSLYRPQSIDLTGGYTPDKTATLILQKGTRLEKIRGVVDYAGSGASGYGETTVKLPAGAYQVYYTLRTDTYQVTTPVERTVLLRAGETRYVRFIELVSTQAIYSWVSAISPNTPAAKTEQSEKICQAEEDSYALVTCLRLAQAGDVPAMIHLIHIYTKSKTLPWNSKNAFGWAKKAADAGNVFSQYAVGVAYHYGLGTPADREKARHYTELAAEGGSLRAVEQLAESYRYGWFTNVDKQKAYQLSKQVVISGGFEDLVSATDQMLSLARGKDEINQAFAARNLLLRNIRLKGNNSNEKFILDRASDPHSGSAPELIIATRGEANPYRGRICLAAKDYPRRQSLSWSVNSVTVSAASTPSMNLLLLDKPHEVAVYDGGALLAKMEFSLSVVRKSACVAYNSEFSEWRRLPGDACHC